MSTRNSPTPVRVLYLIYGSARVCAKCAKLLGEDKVPHLSVKAGVDFGNYRRVGLEEPNLHEQLVISLYRIYFASVKLSSNTTGKVNFDVRSTFQGNANMFMHNTKEWMREEAAKPEFFLRRQDESTDACFHVGPTWVQR